VSRSLAASEARSRFERPNASCSISASFMPVRYRVRARRASELRRGHLHSGLSGLAFHTSDGPSGLKAEKAGVPSGWQHGGLYSTNRRGVTTVFRPPIPEKSEHLAMNDLGEPSNTTPAISDGQISCAPTLISTVSRRTKQPLRLRVRSL
jgi:hypothetical protein